MIITNIDFVPGYEVTESLGLVKGSSIRAKHLGKDLLAVYRQIVGGEITEYSEMINESRQISMDKMTSEAQQLSADAIINIRFATSNVMQGASEILVYGTAVKLAKK